MSRGYITLKSYFSPSSDEIAQLIGRPTLQSDDLNETIARIFNGVKQRGDEAIQDFTTQFDGVTLSSLIVPADEKIKAIRNLDPELKSAIDVAYTNIFRFHKAQSVNYIKIPTSYGVTCWQEARPIDKVGLYIPGGTAPLFSTVLMLGIPAQLAGCTEIVICSPPGKNGALHPAILYAAEKCGIELIIKAGGAQAIAGMVFGTASIPNVYKIFGPGNQYVTAAKMNSLNYGVSIDLPAGPSEVLVFADRTANPKFVAADLLSQAEHGADSQVVLVTTYADLVEKVNTELNVQLETLSRAIIARQALDHAYAVVHENIVDAFYFINEYAPEHLILASDNAERQIEMIRNAGSVFLGHYTPESAGDYASGTNHTLPTAAFARSYSGVSLDSFLKKITFQQISREGLNQLGPTIITLAQHEQLTAHAMAVQIRMEEK